MIPSSAALWFAGPHAAHGAIDIVARGIGWAVLLLDEHTAALDPQSADQVVRLTHDIIERDKLTTLMVTHSMQSERNRAR